MKKILQVTKFNQMVMNKSNSDYMSDKWIFGYKRGFIAYNTNSARYFTTKKEATLSPEENYN